MKNTLLLLVGATTLSLASCSQEKTTDTTTTTTMPTDSTATATTTTTTTDATYKARGGRMADKFASDMKITDAATKEKLRTAYYNRSKRYDMMHQKYKSDTTGMAAAMRQYNTDTDAEFQTILLVPSQYQAYQSSRSTYNEANNLDTADQSTAASSSTTPSDSSTSSSTTTTATSSNMSSAPAGGAMSSGAGVEKSKTKMTDGSKIKVKDDGTVKVKDANGDKSKM